MSGPKTNVPLHLLVVVLLGACSSGRGDLPAPALEGTSGVLTAAATAVFVGERTSLTAVFAGIGVTTPPRSGPFCVSDCLAYPYLDVARFIPADYVWLVPGILLVPIFVVLMACIHAYASDHRKIYGRIALLFALVYAVVVAADYFVQFAVVVPSAPRKISFTANVPAPVVPAKSWIANVTPSARM